MVMTARLLRNMSSECAPPQFQSPDDLGPHTSITGIVITDISGKVVIWVIDKAVIWVVVAAAEASVLCLVISGQ